MWFCERKLFGELLRSFVRIGYEEDGLEGLKDRSSEPHHEPSEADREMIETRVLVRSAPVNHGGLRNVPLGLICPDFESRSSGFVHGRNRDTGSGDGDGVLRPNTDVLRFSVC